MARVCPCWRAYDLRQQHHGCLSTSWNLYRSDPEGRKAKRTAGGAADKVRAGDQSQDRQGAGPRSTGEAARPRRRGDRIRAVLLQLLTTASGTKRTFYACRRMSVLGEKAVMQRTSLQ